MMQLLKRNRLKQTKEALISKYARLSKCASSSGKRRQFANKAEKYRRQVKQLE